MATRVFEPCKIRKRKPELFGFRSFANPGSTIAFCATFRDNIRLFLQECADISDHGVAGMPTWCTFLVNESNGSVFPLYTIEESVQFSLRPFCDHCKCIGWGHHFVSKRRYHMIIPDYENWDKPLKGNFLELRTHFLHGLIHCNGFGHLLCINGIEEDSNCLPKFHLMDLWDRICTILQTRKISVSDDLKERSMELRLLHGVAFQQSWFGKWGYKFGRGSFGVVEHQYNSAINFLSTLDLEKIVDDFKNTSRGREIQQIIRNYREFSETQLVTMSDLLQFMLDFKSRAKNPNSKTWSRETDQSEPRTEDNPISTSTFVSSLASIDCRWPQKRLEYALKVIANLLKNNKETAMSRKELREEARQCIGDTGLIDFVLKSINNLVVDNQIIRRSINPSTKLVEFTIHDVVKRTDMSTESYTESSSFLSSAVKFDSRWPQQRLEQAAKVIWKVLRENKEMISGKSSISRQELRDLARQHVGDTGLIDFVLKSIDGSIVGNQIVCRSRNPSSKLVEFTIEDVSDQSGVENMVGLSPTLAPEPGFDVYEDVLFLYENVLFGYPESDSVSDSVSWSTLAVMDSKRFVKEWRVKDEVNEYLMTLTCRVLPSFDELETELTRPLPPGELVVVPPWITVGELKVVAQCALRDTYCVMEGFIVSQIGGLKGLEDERVLSCAVEAGAHVWVRGCGLDLGTKVRYEGGVNDWTVDCVCGTKDHDGERMVGCDGCHVWQHTRCNNIEDDEPTPSPFLCIKCGC
ncbi:PHD finger protein MALE MEIOCYTE DEATH 1 [Camellia lanceoleosa]|uniref:PHD finger protein MALE MEIOCYTE DEATH 1 n=1 Tax=Camellia lanceoleosa TaxID=1840588 RepID=A0ACC0FZC4_9ERIC|nr:PHD finger protein MALE MEIOCYTE DEATH 1 [Camellia lanceoleosa]